MSNPDQLGCYALIIVNVASTSFDNIEEVTNYLMNYS